MRAVETGRQDRRAEPSRRFELILASAPLNASAADDHATSRRLLDSVAAGELDGALRVWRPVPALALTRLDELRPGAPKAVAAARRAGLPAVRRMSGGHAVVLSPGSLCVGLAEPASSFGGIYERYERFGGGLAAALADVGLIVEHGALAGEWCPGAWSLRAGKVKLAGLAQRAIKGAAWLEAVIELAPHLAARQLLTEVYAALVLPLEVGTLGSMAEVAGVEVTFDAIAARLVERLTG
jgi:octanoyl-[GcvH]:protein N-octanoyltransferase